MDKEAPINLSNHTAAVRILKGIAFCHISSYLHYEHQSITGTQAKADR